MRHGGRVAAGRRSWRGCSTLPAPRLAFWVLTAWVLAGGVLTGCATSGGYLSPTGRLARLPAGAPWEIPADAYPSQRLFRIRYDGPEGDLNFRLTLYLQDAAHFRMLATDGLGRKLWTLTVESDDRALWLDHREEVYCVTQGASQLAVVPLAHLPLAALPRLLLGRLPAPPVTELAEEEGKLSYRDADGRLWNGLLAEGRPQWWTLVEGGEPLAWWRPEEDGEGGIYSDRRGQLQLRWRETVREPLPTPLAPLAIPPAYRERTCDVAAR